MICKSDLFSSVLFNNQAYKLATVYSCTRTGPTRTGELFPSFCCTQAQTVSLRIMFRIWTNPEQGLTRDSADLGRSRATVQPLTPGDSKRSSHATKQWEKEKKANMTSIAMYNCRERGFVSRCPLQADISCFQS